MSVYLKYGLSWALSSKDKSFWRIIEDFITCGHRQWGGEGLEGRRMAEINGGKEDLHNTFNKKRLEPLAPDLREVFCLSIPSPYRDLLVEAPATVLFRYVFSLGVWFYQLSSDTVPQFWQLLYWPSKYYVCSMLSLNYFCTLLKIIFLEILIPISPSVHSMKPIKKNKKIII